MKRYQTTIMVLVIAILLMISLAGCRKSTAKQAEAEAEQVGEAPEEAVPAPAVQPQQQPVRTRTVTTPPAPSRTTAAPRPPATEQLTDYKDPKVKRLINNADTKVTSYAFYYQTSANWNLIRDQYFIRGNKMKIKLYEVNFYNRKHYFDTVYLDMVSQSGYAYCETRQERRCLDPNREFIVSYNDFIIKTPLELVKEIPYDAVWTGTEQIDSRAADVVEYDRADGTIVRIKLDAYSGVPREVWIFLGDVENLLERYAFRDLAINSIKESDVDHQFI